MATLTAYGLTSDGVLYKDASSWAGVPAATPSVNTVIDTYPPMRSKFSASSYRLCRYFGGFDLSSAAGTITEAVISVYCVSVVSDDDQLLYASTWGGTLTDADWSAIGDELAERTSWTTSAYNSFTLDAADVSFGSGWYFALVCKDESTAPTGTNYAEIRHADYSGTTFDPKIVITYTPASGNPHYAYAQQ